MTPVSCPSHRPLVMIENFNVFARHADCLCFIARYKSCPNPYVRMTLNKNLILESNFHTVELEKLHKMAYENNYEVLTLVLRGDVEILHKRYLD